MIDKLLSDFNSGGLEVNFKIGLKDLVTVNGKIIKSNYKVKLNDGDSRTEKVVEADILRRTSI